MVAPFEPLFLLFSFVTNLKTGDLRAALYRAGLGKTVITPSCQLDAVQYGGSYAAFKQYTGLGPCLLDFSRIMKERLKTGQPFFL